MKRIIAVLIMISLFLVSCQWVTDTRTPEAAEATRQARATAQAEAALTPEPVVVDAHEEIVAELEEILEAEDIEAAIEGLIDQIEHPQIQPTECLIKGNLGRNFEKIYHLPGMVAYNATIINENRCAADGACEQWLCSESEAQEAGFRRAQR